MNREFLVMLVVEPEVLRFVFFNKQVYDRCGAHATQALL